LYSNFSQEKKNKNIQWQKQKQNIDVKIFGELFTYIYLGTALNDALKKGLNTKHLKKLFLNLYNQIKI
jgi:hypothetical protein